MMKSDRVGPPNPRRVTAGELNARKRVGFTEDGLAQIRAAALALFDWSENGQREGAIVGKRANSTSRYLLEVVDSERDRRKTWVWSTARRREVHRERRSPTDWRESQPKERGLDSVEATAVVWPCEYLFDARSLL
jgi:hypothetical protein